MRDFLLHEFLKMGPIGMLFLVIGSFFLGVFLALIIRIEKSKINYIESKKKPWRKSVIIGYRGAKPVYDTMYSAKFMRFLYGKLKGSWAKIKAYKEIGKI